MRNYAHGREGEGEEEGERIKETEREERGKEGGGVEEWEGEQGRRERKREGVS